MNNVMAILNGFLITSRVTKEIEYCSFHTPKDNLIVYGIGNRKLYHRI